eukprot:GILJ01006034.1.p1 GENE.GILJ01006034.1~~GILJ01006034.1.p1  ORF type:complete len:328 (-),score=42.25 GILJ01006034.1:177-1160(-)
MALRYPQRMSAAIVPQHGDHTVLDVRVAWPVAECKEFEVLVEVKATAVSRLDCKMRSGNLKNKKAPFITGLDVSGVVYAVGRRVQRFKVGDEVFGWAKTGAAAEYAICEESDLCIKPANLTFPESASLPVCGATAYAALVELGKLQRGQNVLVIGATGGVGSAAVQIARHFKANVHGVGSGQHAEFAKDLGVSRYVSYDKEDFGVKLFGECYDVIVDTVGGRHMWLAGKKLLRSKTGRFVSTAGLSGSEGASSFLTARKLESIFAGGNRYSVVNGLNSRYLSKVCELCCREILRPTICTSLKLDEIARAHRLVETQSIPGKVVITLT